MSGRCAAPVMGSLRQAGFTLLELIVAAGILALIAVFSWRGLDALIREREAIASSQATIDVLQRSFARIERDALLASDAQLDEDGAMRLAAGASSADETSSTTVEYRLLGGALTRMVVGIDSAPQLLMDGVAALAVEAWVPAPRGGGWVRVKGAASEAPRPAPKAASAPGTSLPTNGTALPAPQINAAGSAQPTGAQQQPIVAPTGPTVAAATGIRLSLVRGDGSRVVRSFLVGGG